MSLRPMGAAAFSESVRTLSGPIYVALALWVTWRMVPLAASFLTPVLLVYTTAKRWNFVTIMPLESSAAM